MAIVAIIHGRTNSPTTKTLTLLVLLVFLRGICITLHVTLVQRVIERRAASVLAQITPIFHGDIFHVCF